MGEKLKVEKKKQDDGVPCKKKGSPPSRAEIALMLLFVERRRANPELSLKEYHAQLDAVGKEVVAGIPEAKLRAEQARLHPLDGRD